MIKCVSKFLLLYLTLYGLLLTSCIEKDLYESDREENPSLLDYATSKAVKLVIEYDAPSGFSAPFQVYAENPYTRIGDYLKFRADLKPLAGGIVVSGRYELNKVLPAYATDLYVYSPNIFAPTLMHAEVNGSVAMFDVFNFDFQADDNQDVETRSWRGNMPDLYLGYYGFDTDVSANHRPVYVDEAMTRKISAEVMQKIAGAFPSQQKPDSKYAGNASIHLKEKGEVWVSVIVSDGDFNNTLSYFCYDGPAENLATLSLTEREKLKEIVAFPAAKLNTKDYRFALKAGEYVQLMYYNSKTGKLEKEFPAGTTIGWMLRAKGYNTLTKKLMTNVLTDNSQLSNIYYSVPEWNPEPRAEDRNHTIIFNAGTGAEPFYCFGFEDWYNADPLGDGDCNDVMFNVIVNPMTAVYEPPTEIPGTEDVVAHDTRYGILAFEDYWPLKWDYDMNDVVMKYESAVTLLQKAGELDVYATEVNDVYTLIHTGADYKNKFSVKMDMNIALLQSVTVNGKTPTLQMDGEGFIIDLFENAGSEITPYAHNQSKEYKVNLKFRAPGILQSNYNCYAPYNPFITPASGKDVAPGTEVHLPMYPPTARADASLFGTKDDRSNPELGIYYVSDAENKYPFAFHLSGVDNFKIASEGKAISTEYPNFLKWVESGLTNYNDWYVIP